MKWFFKRKKSEWISDETMVLVNRVTDLAIHPEKRRVNRLRVIKGGKTK